jgi:hypothetical protein
MVETGPAGGSRSSTTGPGLKGFRPSSVRWQADRHREGRSVPVGAGRCPLLREVVLDGLGAPPAVTADPGVRDRPWISARCTER